MYACTDKAWLPHRDRRSATCAGRYHPCRSSRSYPTKRIRGYRRYRSCPSILREVVTYGDILDIQVRGFEQSEVRLHALIATDICTVYFAGRGIGEYHRELRAGIVRSPGIAFQLFRQVRTADTVIVLGIVPPVGIAGTIEIAAELESKKSPRDRSSYNGTMC